MHEKTEQTISISIIIPCFNVQEYIEECVTSCINQSSVVNEIICIDNNSTDNTWEILKSLKQQFPSLIIDQELRKGAPYARNKGLNKATSKWIQFLDSDDLLFPTKIEHQAKLVKDHPNADYIIASSFRKFTNGSIKLFTPETEALNGIFKSNFGNTCSNLWKKSAIMQIDGWNTSLASSQEYDLLFRLFIKGYKYHLDLKPLTMVRNRVSGQITQNNPKKKWYNYALIRGEMLLKLRQSGNSSFENNSSYFENILFDQIRVLAQHDLKTACELRKKYLKDFSPKISSANTRIYVFLYKIIGFRLSEKLRTIKR